MGLNVYGVIMVLFSMAYAGIRFTAGPELRRIVDARFYACFALLTLCGLVLPDIRLFFVACVVALIALPRRPVEAVCLYVLLFALTPGAVGDMSLGGFYLLRLNTGTFLSLAAFIVFWARWGSRAGTSRGFSAEDGIVLVLFLALGVGAARDYRGIGLAREVLEQVIALTLPYLILRRHLRSVADLRLIIATVAAASIFLSVFAVYESTMGWTLFGAIKGNLTEVTFRTANRAIRGSTLRASVTMSGALSLACYLVIGWIAAACSRREIRRGWMWAGWLGVIGFGLLCCQSRGNLVALGVAAVLLLALRGRGVAATMLALAAAVGGGSLILLANYSPMVAGLVNPGGAEEGELYDYRQILLRRGLEEAAKHRWIGADLQYVLGQLADITQGEGIVDLVNTYLVIYLVSGLLGVVPLLLLVILIVRKLMRRMRRTAALELVAARAFALIALALFLFQLSFMSFIDRLPFEMGLVMAAARIVDMAWRRERAGQPARARPGGGPATTASLQRREKSDQAVEPAGSPG